MKIEIYSDGSGTTKKTPGGYGYVIVVDGIKHIAGSGHMPFATNNDAELEAAIQGLSSAETFLDSTITSSSNEVWLVSDSQIILNWASGRNEFKQEDKYDKYEKLMYLMHGLNAKTRWVPGHTGEEFNEECDKLANAARLNLSVEEAHGHE